MRTEFRDDSSSISMSQLYLGGGLVPTTANTTCTVSEVSNILCGTGYSGARANHGNAASPCGASALGENYGYFRGGVTPSGSINWTSPANGHVDNTFFYNATYFTNPAPPETVVDLTFSHTGTYHYVTVSYEAVAGTFKIGTSSDDDSQVSDTLQGSGSSPVARYGTFSATAGTPVRVSIKLPYTITSGVHSNIYNAVYINTADSSESAGHIRSMTVNTSVPTGGSGDTEFQFSDLYGAAA